MYNTVNRYEHAWVFQSGFYVKFQFLSLEALYLRFGTCCRKVYKYKLLIFSRLSDFMTCSAPFNIKSDESISQLWKIAGR